ncbi:TRAP transporter small permease [Fluviibacterium sp. DFM31]|uniref:TRAP transporter small permease protein n=1 Tax=Meridianimarinicoccus marinus TaxID=3231483 RepID=A0ABV3L4X6_9RHOB
MPTLNDLRSCTIAALEWLALGLGAVLLGLTVCDVVGRYGFNRPLFGATEVIQWIMGAFVFCGLGLVSARNTHVAIDLISPRLAQLYPRLMSGVIGIFTAVGLAAIAWQLAHMGFDAALRGKQSLVLEVAVAVPLLAYSLLCGLATALHLTGRGR